MDVVRPMNAFSAVGAGQRANVRLPTGDGMAYARLLLLTALSPAEIVRLTLTLNTVVIVDITGQEMVMRRKYFGLPDKSGDGLYELDLRTPSNAYRSRQGRDATSILTQDGDVLTLEIDIAAGATNPTLKGYAMNYMAANKVRGQSVPMRRTQLLTIKRQSQSSAQLGEFENYNMPLGPRVIRAHIGGGTGAIDDLRIDRNSQIMYDASKVINDAILESAGRFPQGNYFHYDPVVEGFVTQDTLTTASQSFIWRMNASQAGTIPMLFERLEFVG